MAGRATPGVIRKRSFFQWRDVPLTGLISFEVTSTRQIRILDAHSRERILEIPKEYWSDGKLLQDLKEFYRGHGRYHGEIDIPA